MRTRWKKTNLYWINGWKRSIRKRYQPAVCAPVRVARRGQQAELPWGPSVFTVIEVDELIRAIEIDVKPATCLHGRKRCRQVRIDPGPMMVSLGNIIVSARQPT